MNIHQPPPVAATSVPLPPPLLPRRNPLLQILESSKVKTDSILEAPNQKSQDYYNFATANSTSPSAAIHRPESDMLLGFLRKGPVSSNPAPPPPGLQLAVPEGTGQPTFQAAIAGSEDLSKQKSQALLSLLRTQSVTSPAPKATMTTRTTSGSIDITESSAPPPPLTNPPPPSTPTAATYSNVDEIGASAAAPLVPTVNAFQPSAKKSFCYRVTKNQVGKLRIVVRREGQQGSSNGARKSGNIAHEEDRDVLICESGVNVRPGQFFTLEWILPERYIRECKDASSGQHPDLVVGLVRYGEPSPSIFLSGYYFTGGCRFIL